MTSNPSAIEPKPTVKEIRPGFLLEPFRWAAGAVIASIEARPDRWADLFSLSRKRMHLIALALAHCPKDVPRDLSTILLTGPAEVILDISIGRRPFGLKGVFDRLDPWVLEKATYRTLVELLDDPSVAKLLSHAPSISDRGLQALKQLPPKLRPAVFGLDDLLLPCFADGLRLLVAKGVSESFEQLTEELERFKQSSQLVAKLRRMIEQLPLPNVLPPDGVGQGRRIDTVAEIRYLGKKWKNCLENYVREINHGTHAIYLWDGSNPAIAMIERRGRLGWFLGDVKGPRNAEVELTAFRQVKASFAEFGIPHTSVADALEEIIDNNRRAHRLRRRERENIEPSDEDWSDLDSSPQ